MNTKNALSWLKRCRTWNVCDEKNEEEEAENRKYHKCDSSAKETEIP